LAGPDAPGVHENTQANELPLEMVTVFGQLIGSYSCVGWKGGVG
jgi:hypothetical protein